MFDIIYNGNSYKLIKNKSLFNCINVLFMGFIFIDNVRYKKYLSANNICYLIEGQKMINFNYKGNKYYILSWSVSCGLMEIKKQGGKIGRFIKHDDKIKLSDFLGKLEKLDFIGQLFTKEKQKITENYLFST